LGRAFSDQDERIRWWFEGFSLPAEELRSDSPMGAAGTMKVTIVGMVLLVAAIVGVFLLLAQGENQDRTPQTDTNVDCQQDESLQDEMDAFAQ
jgi:hypothetical protein